jgi:hypothetical protein
VIELPERYNASMPSERNKTSENPYASPQPVSEPQTETPPPEPHWAWALITSAMLLSLVVFMSLWWFREFGPAGLAMLIGGFTGSYFGWWMSKERWWGLASGAIVGLTAGAAFGIVWLFASL